MNKLTNIIRKSKRDHYTERLKSTQGDSKRTWQVLNEVLGRGQKGTILPDTNGNGSKNVINLTNSFNNHFASLGENLASKIIQPQGTSYRQYLHGNYSSSFFLRPTDRDEIYTIIMNMKSSHTSGADEICSTILKAIVNVILEPLVYCINLSLLSGQVPKMAKIARILPIYKSGDKNDINNYRPISILPTLSKVLEKIVYSRLSGYLDKLGFLVASQYGFRKNSTTCMAVLDLIEKNQ